MDKAITVKVVELIGSPLCISSDDGQKVFDKLKELLNAGKKVVISFERVDMLISLFLNVAIGQLYGSFSEDEVKARVEVIGLSEEDMVLLKRVIDNAKRYFANSKSYDEAWLSEEDEDEH